MAQTYTTISAAVTASDQIIPVTSATGFTAGNYLRIDNEFMVVVSVSGTNITVTFLNADAKANTVTYTAGFYGDTTSSDVATFAAKTGASFSIIARGGTWGIIALANVTLA